MNAPQGAFLYLLTNCNRILIIIRTAIWYTFQGELRMGCFFAVFAVLWKILKAVLKILWKVLKLLLFKCGLIFVGAYVLGAFLINLIYSIGLCPGGEMEGWYFAGLALSIICTAAVIILGATRKDRKDKRDKTNKQDKRDKDSKNKDKDGGY